MAILLMVLGPSLYSMGFVYANEQKLHPVTTSVVRGLTLIFVTYLIAWKTNTDLTFKSKHTFKWQLIRNSIMVLQGLVYAWAQFYLPLPVAITLQSTSPIFTAIFDKILNGVNLNKKQTMWLTVAFLGVVLTANGTYLSYLWTGKTVETNSKFENYFSTDPSMLVLAALILVVTQFVHGYGTTVTKKLKDSNSIQVNFFQGLLITFTGSVLVPLAFAEADYH
jgi:drug/metabolite transporter (DMT)-like permease